MRSLAAPIRDAEGNVIATIGISVPSFELPNSRIERVAKAVKKASQEVSKRLRAEKAEYLDPARVQRMNAFKCVS